MGRLTYSTSSTRTTSERSFELDACNNDIDMVWTCISSCSIQRILIALFYYIVFGNYDNTTRREFLRPLQLCTVLFFIFLSNVLTNFLSVVIATRANKMNLVKEVPCFSFEDYRPKMQKFSTCRDCYWKFFPTSRVSHLRADIEQQVRQPNLIHAGA